MNEIEPRRDERSDPFDMLYRLRAKQRWSLRMIESWIVAERWERLTGRLDTVDSIPAEWAARQEAETLRVELADLLGKLEQSIMTRTLIDHVEESIQAAGGRRDDLNSLRAKLAQRPAPIGELSSAPPADVLNLRFLVQLLVWADDLAGDYTDPRLK